MPEEYLAHYGVKGMKWGVRKKQPKRLVDYDPAKIKRKPVDNDASIVKTNIRIQKEMLRHPVAAGKLGMDMSIAGMKHPAKTMKFASNGYAAATKYSKRFAKALDMKMDSIKNDISKIKIGRDFFEKHGDATINDILKDGDLAMTLYLLNSTHDVRHV